MIKEVLKYISINFKNLYCQKCGEKVNSGAYIYQGAIYGDKRNSEGISCIVSVSDGEGNIQYKTRQELNWQIATGRITKYNDPKKKSLESQVSSKVVYEFSDKE